MKIKFCDKWVLVVLTAAVFLVTGCGIKGPPLPSENRIPAPPYRLTHHLVDDTVTLSWSYPADTTGSVAVKGFEVFSASRELSDGACRGCPVEFGQVATVASDSLSSNHQIQKGYKYYYRVRAYTDSKVKSSYSNTVQFEANP